LIAIFFQYIVNQLKIFLTINKKFRIKHEKKVVILGAGAHARSVLNAFRDANKSKIQWHIIGFIDENKKLHGKIICNDSGLNEFDLFDINKRDDIYLMNAIASPRVKRKIV